MHTLRQVQILPVSRQVLWDFVSVPQNLNQITPPKMAFKIVGESPEAAYAGLLSTKFAYLCLLDQLVN